MPDERPADDLYYESRLEPFSQGDIFRDVPLAYPSPADSIVLLDAETAGSRRFLSGPFDVGLAMLTTPRCYQLSPLVMKRSVLVWVRAGDAATTAVRPSDASKPASTAGKTKVRIRIGPLSCSRMPKPGNGRSPPSRTPDRTRTFPNSAPADQRCGDCRFRDRCSQRSGSWLAVAAVVDLAT
jgi:hypothetical protein